jgi:hypothetical protein
MVSKHFRKNADAASCIQNPLVGSFMHKLEQRRRKSQISNAPKPNGSMIPKAIKAQCHHGLADGAG